MGPRVTSQTPLVSLVIGAPWLLPGISPPDSVTRSACGARIRNVTCPSASTSGETTWGPCGPRPAPTLRPGWAGGAAAGWAKAARASVDHVQTARLAARLIHRVLFIGVCFYRLILGVSPP